MAADPDSDLGGRVLVLENKVRDLRIEQSKVRDKQDQQQKEQAEMLGAVRLTRAVVIAAIPLVPAVFLLLLKLFGK